VRALAEKFGVAPMTISSALRLLKDEGVVSSVHGRGTFVREGGESELLDRPDTAKLAEQVTQLDAKLEALSARLDRLEAKN
jgi:DNA-binding GntR family transcriptional regulator